MLHSEVALIYFVLDNFILFSLVPYSAFNVKSLLKDVQLNIKRDYLHAVT